MGVKYLKLHLERGVQNFVIGYRMKMFKSGSWVQCKIRHKMFQFRHMVVSYFNWYLERGVQNFVIGYEDVQKWFMGAV